MRLLLYAVFSFLFGVWKSIRITLEGNEFFYTEKDERAFIVKSKQFMLESLQFMERYLLKYHFE